MSKIRAFMGEVVAEVHKVTWPKKEELVGSAMIVLIFVSFFAVLLGTMDFVFSSIIQKIIEWSGGLR